ncbi:MAG: RsmD family RNA methyltransferase [Chthoniobacterales bacterium]
MRIVAGSAGGIHLQTPSNNVRPTMDRVRGAIFSSLGDLVPGTHCLDLFCGSGALGIEALSRGAASCDFVDSHRSACTCTQSNLRKASLQGQVHCLDALHFLAKLARPLHYDIIFADPPYFKKQKKISRPPANKETKIPDWTSILCTSADLVACLRPGATLVLESGPSTLPPLADGLSLLKSKSYGGTTIHYILRSPLK